MIPPQCPDSIPGSATRLSKRKKMTEEQLNELGYDIERHGNGYILADYSGNTKTPQGARYCGVSMSWRFQPLCVDPFPDKVTALQAAMALEARLATNTTTISGLVCGVDTDGLAGGDMFIAAVLP